MTKLDFDKEPTPGPKHYPTPDNIREPLVQDKMPDKEEVQVGCFSNVSLLVSLNITSTQILLSSDYQRLKDICDYN